MPERFPCPRLNSQVGLSDERREHILASHVDGPEVLKRLAQTFEAPDVGMEARLTGEFLVAKAFDFTGRPRHIVGIVLRDESKGRRGASFVGCHSVHYAKVAERGTSMADRMAFNYDAVGDILYVNFVPPYAEQDSDMISDGIVARTNPQTGRVESLELLWFMASLRGGDSIDLPLDSNLMPIWSEIDAACPPAKQNAGHRAAV